MRVDNRASVAYAAASFCPRPRGKKRWCGRAAHRAWLTWCTIRSARGLTWFAQGACTHAYTHAWEKPSARAQTLRLSHTTRKL